MREIKFRAWLKEEKITIDVSEIDFRGEEVSGFDESDVFYEGYGYDYAELMQYTGLKDKNGKEIYEGDIGKSVDGIFLVTWDEEKAAFVMRFYGYPEETLYLEEMWNDAEVIGNIYENPELLEGEQCGI